MAFKRSVRIPFFRIWYSSAFVILFLITFVLTLVSPADLIYQAAKDDRSVANIIAVAVVYFAAALLCFFIWASRIYTNRAVLRDIPKHYLPIDAGEVPRKVRRVIEKQWRRSALVAWDSRPRDVSVEIRAEVAAEAMAATTTTVLAAATVGAHVEDEAVVDGSGRRAERRFRRRERVKDTKTVSAKVALKAWGRIAHPGWSTPDAASGQTESVEYTSVIVELPNLLEAKAVSLAPAHATLLPMPNGSQEELLATGAAAPPDARVVAMLQCPPRTGLRDYLNHLTMLDIIASPGDAESFLQQYEYARFSTQPLTESRFESLMAVFATLLSGMTLDLDRIMAVLPDDASESLGSMETRSLSAAQSTILPGVGIARTDDGTSSYSADAPEEALAQLSTYEPTSSTTSGSMTSVIVQSRT